MRSAFRGRREPVVRLDDLPSHRAHKRAPVPGRAVTRRPGRLLRWIALATIGIVGTVAALGALVVAGPLRSTLEQRIESTVIAGLPDDYELQIGDTRLAFDLPASMGVRFDNVVVRSRWNAAILMEAASLSLTMKPRALLEGRTDISTITLNDAVAHLPPREQAVTLPAIADLDAFKQAVFDQLAVLDARLPAYSSGLALRFNEIAVLQPTSNGLVRWSVPEGRADLVPDEPWRAQGAVARLSASETAAPSEFEITVGTGEQRTVTARLDQAPLPLGRVPFLFSNEPDDNSPGRTYPPLPTDITVSLADAGEGIRAEASLAFDTRLKLAEDDFITLRTPVSLVHGPGRDTIDIRRGDWRIGNNRGRVEGGLRDAPERAGAYEFELLANNGTMAPSDAQIEPLRFSSRVRGVFTPETRRIALDDVTIETPEGTLDARGELDFSPDAPAMVILARSDSLSTAALQRLWPAPIARGARRWVLQNLAGGTVRDLVMDIVEPLQRRDPVTQRRIDGATTIDLAIENTRFDVAGNIPPVRDATGRIAVEPGTTIVTLETGTVFMPSGRTAALSDGSLTISAGTGDDVPATASFRMAGDAEAVGELITFPPIAADRFYDFDPATLSGAVEGSITIDLLLNDPGRENSLDWQVVMDVRDAAPGAPVEGRSLSGVDGKIDVNPDRALLDVTAQIDGLPASIDMTIPFKPDIAARRDIELRLAAADREKLAPGLETIISGTTPVTLGTDDGRTQVNVDLTSAGLALPWIGWEKSAGVSALAAFALNQSGSTTRLEDFSLNGDGFSARGSMTIADGLRAANFSRVVLNRDDSISVNVQRNGAAYAITVRGETFDARALIRKARAQMSETGSGDATPVSVDAVIGRLNGFNGEVLTNASLRMNLGASGLQSFSLTAKSSSGMPVTVALDGTGPNRRIRIEAMDAGEVLRFVDLYGQVRGGVLEAALRGTASGGLGGEIKLSNFRVFNEPRLNRLVSERAGERSLQDAVRRDIDTREVVFETGYADVRLDDGRLDLNRAILRGPLIGMSLAGTAYDKNNRMRLTGTFLPAYGLNSLFADIPIFGAILGGRDRGLIGVTFLLSGNADKPDVTVNPLSAIAPGIFRSIFEFR